MASRGRPSLLTPKLKEEFLQAIAAGCHYEQACSYVGIDYTTFREWMLRGSGAHKTRKSNQEYADFAEDVQKAVSKGEISAIAAIRAATKEDWRAAAWMLERRHSDRWASTQKIQLQVERQVEAELNLLFEAIVNDPTIPSDVKLRIIEKAENLQSRAAVAAEN